MWTRRRWTPSAPGSTRTPWSISQRPLASPSTGRRDCLRQVGLLDADLFGRGYGAEMIFAFAPNGSRLAQCSRGRHLRVPPGRSVVWQREGTGSPEGGRDPNQKYPGYSALVAGHTAGNPAHSCRRRIDLWRIAGPSAALPTSSRTAEEIQSGTCSTWQGGWKKKARGH